MYSKTGIISDGGLSIHSVIGLLPNGNALSINFGIVEIASGDVPSSFNLSASNVHFVIVSDDTLSQ
jgi:hypothetical protein